MSEQTLTLLQVEALSRHYRLRRGWLQPSASVQALSEVSFSLPAGRTLAVVGESGCGKSTLARQLTLIERPSSGRLLLQGQDAADDAARRALRSQVQMVFQNPFASLNPRKTIAATLAEPLRINTRMNAAEREQRLLELIEQVGLRREHLQRYPHMFSGGQRQRIAIARAMALRPALIVADEPTSALDVSIQAQILNLFMDLQAREGCAYVFISHNLAVVRHVADEVMVMLLGRIVEIGPKQALFERPLHPYTQALLAAAPRLGRAAPDAPLLHGEAPNPLQPPPGCPFHQRCPQALPRCASERPALREHEGRQIACHLYP